MPAKETRSLCHSRELLDVVFGGASLIVLVGCWFLIRQQTAVTDRQFLRSMIPHHASAILMCQEAPMQDQGLKDLCKNIMSSQQARLRPPVNESGVREN